MRIDKKETIQFLRKQLQVLMIQVWSLLQQVENRYYLMDDFEIVSLYPPAKHQHDVQNETREGTDNSMIGRGPPAGNFRFNDTSMSTSHAASAKGRKAKVGAINASEMGTESSEEAKEQRLIRVNNTDNNSTQQLIREKSLPQHGGETFAGEWFDYKNQIEIKVIFVPFLTCKIPLQIPQTKSFDAAPKNRLTTPSPSSQNTLGLGSSGLNQKTRMTPK